MICICGHDFFDHIAVGEEIRNAEVQLCRFDYVCGCTGFEESKETTP